METHPQVFTQSLLLEAGQRNTSYVTDSLLGIAPWITPHHIHWCVSPATQAMRRKRSIMCTFLLQSTFYNVFFQFSV